MVVTKKNLLMASASVAIAVNFSACKKDKDSQTDKLVGEWEVVSIAGQAPEYVTTWEFEADQDVRYCYTDDYGTYCYQGEWEWTNNDENELLIISTDGSDTDTLNLEIDLLNDDVLEGDISSDGFSAPIELKKNN